LPAPFGPTIAVVGELAALVQHHHSLHAAHQRAHRVLDPHHAQPEVVTYAADERHRDLHLALGKAGRHLVQQQHVRSRAERHADLEQPLPGGRERGGGDGRRLREPDEGEDRAGVVEDGVRVAAAPAGELQAEADVGFGRHVAKDARRLERAGDPVGGEHVRRLTGEVVPAHSESSRAWQQHAGERVEERRLARAIRPDDSHQLARAHVEVHTVHREQAAEADRHSARGEQWFRHRRPPGPARGRDAAVARGATRGRRAGRGRAR
jgi:hypothetical protein